MCTVNKSLIVANAAGADAGTEEATRASCWKHACLLRCMIYKVLSDLLDEQEEDVRIYNGN